MKLWLPLSTILLALLCAAPTHAQIATRSTSQAGVASGNLVIPKPAATNTNDVLVAAISVTPSSRTVATPAGWVQVTNENASANVRLAVFTRVVPAADSGVTDYTFTIAGGAHSGATGGIIAFIGVDTAAPVDRFAVQATASGFAHAAPTITTTARGAQLIAAYAMPGVTDDWLPPPGMIEAIDVASTPIRPDAAGLALTMAYEPRNAPGATGTRTATADSAGISAASARTVLLALQPALDPASTHYRLDGATGSMTGALGEIFDSGGTTLHGFRRTISNPTTTNFIAPNPTIEAQSPAVSGQFCNSASFDGRSVLQVPASPLFDYINEFSASAWIFPTAAPTGGTLYSVLSNDQNYEFHLNNTRRLFWWWGGGVRSLTSNTQIPLNQWTHVAITFRSVAGSARQRIYINGVLDTATNNWAGTLTPNGCDFYIGGDVGTSAGCPVLGDRPFRGNIDEVKLYNYELTAAEVNGDRTIGRTCTNPITRYRIEHDGSANSCAAETVTIRACANADCSSLANTGATGTLVAGGNAVPFSIPVGQTSTTVSLLVPTTTGPPDPELVRFGIGSVSPVPALITSCRNGAGVVDSAGACDISTSDAGFVITVPDHVSDTVQNVRVQAVRRSSPTLACVPLFANVTRNVGFWSNYANPSTGTRAVNLGGVSLGAASPGSPFALSFDSTGTANTTLRYSDAGAIRLQARYAGSSASGDAGLIVTGEDEIVVRPARFELTLPTYNTATAAQSGDATRPVFTTAGLAFPASIRALNASGNVTPNFGREAIPEGVRIESVLEAPLGGNNPTPVMTAGLNTFANGVSSGTLRWDEVGVITLRPRLASAPYLNFVDNGTPVITGDVVGTDLPRIGRFVPARLAVTPNVPTLAPSCIAGGFGYVGQDFGFGASPQLTVSGVNALGAVTGNYVNGTGAANAFWKFAGALANRSYVSTATGTTAVLSRTTNGGSAVVSENTSVPFDGTGLVTINGDRLTYAKPVSPEAPFNALATLTLTAADLTDSDGVCFDTPALNGCDPLTIGDIAGGAQRWGRIAVTNAFGPELMDLQVPMRAEYFTGTTFATNTDDVCTGITLQPIVDANPADSLQPSETCVQDIGSPGASGQGCAAAGPVVQRRYTLTPPVGSGGQFTLWLRAPGAGNVGILDLTPNVPAWLQFNWRGTGPVAPTARVGFGVYQGDRRAIHEREVY